MPHCASWITHGVQSTATRNPNPRKSSAEIIACKNSDADRTSQIAKA
jgi:hypothetical protein